MLPNLMQSFHPENIPLAISSFRPGGEVPVLNDEYMGGGECRIFKVHFLDGETWSVRIPIHAQSDSQDAIIGILRGELDVLQEIQEIGASGFPWAPRLHGFSSTFKNSVGCPFIVLSWIEGSPLLWTADYPPRLVRNKILRQVAEIQMSLIECTKENSIFSQLHSNANAYVYCRGQCHRVFHANNR